MVTATHTPQGDALTNLILELFRAHGQVLAAGDTLTADLRLTSARWQVLGALSLQPPHEFSAMPHLEGLTVADIARSMGLTRQSVQRTVNLLRQEELVTLAPNPRHKRAQLVRLTQQGRDALARATERQVRWANAMGQVLEARGLDQDAVHQASELLKALRGICGDPGLLFPGSDNNAG